ncbi:hypothetical protein J3459_006643 [Metarhizium acridum]|uniref:Uncharacterized protein n=1 Tax=Metarhizium acridum (strain CQMa 102) TaxID=655827 RepID=E9DXF4_METAQ|nr:uncharacterized protein MAC_02302 [Metarhizium acridum CQMa 102]EFY91712.1 hypothetical protein MAC_02302 [Metarhizium acridum CQMa 102]KAG8417451.1 hypothetical protein J3458_004958 [Metarhizium acridum]KAG8427465.1 hypothetical protein J3459_006643 [Metarhizium acridum]
MKVFGFLTALLATASAASVISPEEKADWEGCTNDLISAYNRGAAGDKTSCVFWECLHKNADKYHRGGGIAALSNIITPVCLPVIAWPWDPHTAPKPSWQEVEDWRTCTRDLIKTFDSPTSGNEAACRMWACLHNNVSKYNRGGIVTQSSKLLTPLCNFKGLIPDWN